MRRRHCVLWTEEELLVQLFARPRPGEFDLDVAADLEAGQANQILGEIGNFHWFTHVEGEYFTAVTHRRCLQYELHRLGNRHEVATHLGVCDRDWTARRDLPHERRHDAASTPQHVAESHRDERLPGAVGDTTHDLFGNSFRRAHDARGAYRFIGRDQD